VTPQDNDLNKPQARRTGSPGSVVPILLALAAVVIIVGIWFSTGENNDAHPVTGRDTPAGTQPGSK
jgi:hypothetical protein